MPRIAEIYVSDQGEGRLSGTRSTFIRFSGCNLRCWFCDTMFASWHPEGELQTVEQIIAQVQELETSHVVLTGGEPLLFHEVVPLTHSLASLDLHITVETAGTIHRPVACDLMSISPKLRNSRPDPTEHPRWYVLHEARRHRPEVIRRLAGEYDYQFKFVICTPEDVAEVCDYLELFPELERARIMLMPEGQTRERLAAVAQWLIPLCEAQGFTFCPRKQIEWYGSVRGT